MNQDAHNTLYAIKQGLLIKKISKTVDFVSEVVQTLCSYLLPGYLVSRNSERVLGRKIPWLCMAWASEISCDSELVILGIMHLSVRQQIHGISCKTRLKWCKQECIGLNSTLKHLEWCIKTVGFGGNHHQSSQRLICGIHKMNFGHEFQDFGPK